MTEDQGTHGDVEAYVLGALDEADRAIFEGHLRDCASCQREVASYVPVMQALRDMPMRAAPPLRARSAKIVPFPRALRAVAAAAVLALGVYGGAAAERMRSNDMVTVAEMGATAAADIPLRGDGIEGRAIVGAARHRTAFVVAGLPDAGPDRVYQVWIDNGTTSSPGMLHRSMRGFEVLVVPGDVLRGVHSISVTVEPASGSTHMTGRPIVSGATREV